MAIRNPMIVCPTQVTKTKKEKKKGQSWFIDIL